MAQQTRPAVLGVHHLKFAVSNLDVSIAWYERVLGARRIASLDHIRPDGTRFAVICHMADWAGLFLELRQTEAQARKERGWDPITLTVKNRQGLLEWVQWLDQWRTNHSPVLTGMRGWLMALEVRAQSVQSCASLTTRLQDPDGRRIRFYSREEHGGTETPSQDAFWLGET